MLGKWAQKEFLAVIRTDQLYTIIDSTLNNSLIRFVILKLQTNLMISIASLNGLLKVNLSRPTSGRVKLGLISIKCMQKSFI